MACKFVLKLLNFLTKLSKRLIITDNTEPLRGGVTVFSVGDKVVYPTHGAGVIKNIKEEDILGETKSYYVLSMLDGDLKVMVPVENCHELGLRKIIDRDEVGQILDVLKESENELSSNWNRRYRNNMEKIKTGNIEEVAVVARDLYSRDKEKGLSTGEKKMLEQAIRIVVSELALATETEEEVMREKILECLDTSN
jgi:CarD family transcriptional regulator